jgi:hypothetical protein
MAGDTNDTENLWRWLSHSEDSIFILDGLTNLKDLLVPTQAEMPPSEPFDGCHKNGSEDIPRLVKTIKGMYLPLIKVPVLLEPIKKIRKGR